MSRPVMKLQFLPHLHGAFIFSKESSGIARRMDDMRAKRAEETGGSEHSADLALTRGAGWIWKVKEKALMQEEFSKMALTPEDREIW